jgi:hypothetical protein
MSTCGAQWFGYRGNLNRILFPLPSLSLDSSFGIGRLKSPSPVCQEAWPANDATYSLPHNTGGNVVEPTTSHLSQRAYSSSYSRTIAFKPARPSNLPERLSRDPNLGTSHATLVNLARSPAAAPRLKAIIDIEPLQHSTARHPTAFSLTPPYQYPINTPLTPTSSTPRSWAAGHISTPTRSGCRRA